MCELNDTFAIDQEIATKLEGVSGRAARDAAAEERPGVVGHCAPRKPHLPPTATLEPIRSVEIAGLVDDNGPAKVHAFQEESHPLNGFEGDKEDFDVACCQLVTNAPQLRRVVPAGYSAEVAQEHQKQGMPPELLHRSRAASREDASHGRRVITG